MNKFKTYENKRKKINPQKTYKNPLTRKKKSLKVNKIKNIKYENNRNLPITYSNSNPPHNSRNFIISTINTLTWPTNPNNITNIFFFL